MVDCDIRLSQIYHGPLELEITILDREGGRHHLKKNGNFQVSQMILRIYYRLFCTRVTQSAICV